MEKLISISVAAYNMEKYISENITSFLNSKYLDKIELLIVNDGSKDNTEAIVTEYVNKYPNTVKLINKENGGAGSTVNTGIENATGKYFRMVDGDDYVDSTTLDSFIELLNKSNADMIISNYSLFDADTKKVIEFRSFNLPKDEFQFDDQYLQIPNEMHAITYKTEIMKKARRLDNGFYTDVEYVLFPLEYVNTCQYFNENVYMYRVGQNEQSVNPNRMMKNINQHEIVINSLNTWFNNLNNINDNKIKFISNRISIMTRNNVVTLLFFETNKDSWIRIKNFINDQKKNKYLYNIFKGSKLLKTLRYFKYFGYKYCSKKMKKKYNIQ